MELIDFKDIKAERLGQYKISPTDGGSQITANITADFGTVTVAGTPVVAGVLNTFQSNIATAIDTHATNYEIHTVSRPIFATTSGNAILRTLTVPEGSNPYQMTIYLALDVSATANISLGIGTKATQKIVRINGGVAHNILALNANTPYTLQLMSIGGVDVWVATNYVMSGKWTPVLTSTGISASFSYPARTGSYEISGNMIDCFFNITARRTNSNSTGEIRISLPFPSDSTLQQAGGGNIAYARGGEAEYARLFSVLQVDNNEAVIRERNANGLYATSVAKLAQVEFNIVGNFRYKLA